MEIVTQVLSTVTFRNVRRNRNRGFPQLTLEAVQLLLRKRGAEPVRPHHEVHGTLPDPKVPIASNDRLADCHGASLVRRTVEHGIIPPLQVSSSCSPWHRTPDT